MRGCSLGHSGLRPVAERHEATAARVALAWLLGPGRVNVILKATAEQHVRENRVPLDLRLTADDHAELDRALPPPTDPQPLGTQ